MATFPANMVRPVQVNAQSPRPMTLPGAAPNVIGAMPVVNSVQSVNVQSYVLNIPANTPL